MKMRTRGSFLLLIAGAMAGCTGPLQADSASSSGLGNYGVDAPGTAAVRIGGKPMTVTGAKILPDFADGVRTKGFAVLVSFTGAGYPDGKLWMITQRLGLACNTMAPAGLEELEQIQLASHGQMHWISYADDCGIDVTAYPEYTGGRFAGGYRGTMLDGDRSHPTPLIELSFDLMYELSQRSDARIRIDDTPMTFDGFSITPNASGRTVVATLRFHGAGYPEGRIDVGATQLVHGCFGNGDQDVVLQPGAGQFLTADDGRCGLEMLAMPLSGGRLRGTFEGRVFNHAGGSHDVEMSFDLYRP